MRGKIILIVSVLLAAASLAAAQEQKQARPTAETDRMRARIAEALAKGDPSVEKMMADPAMLKFVPTGGLTNYEQIRSCGFYPQETRLECVIEIKQQSGYGGPIGSFGSFEYVSFFVDWQGTGFQLPDYVGSGIVHITDGSGGTNFAVYRDFNPPGGPRTSNGGTTTTTTTGGPILKARAILSWAVPVTDPNQTPFWGNVFDFAVRLMPIR